MNISQSDVEEIVARWIGMKLLRDFYRCKSVRRRYMDSSNPPVYLNIRSNWRIGERCHYPGDIGLSLRSPIVDPADIALSTGSRDLEYDEQDQWTTLSTKRFYRACTIFWFQQQACYLHKISLHRDQDVAYADANSLLDWELWHKHDLVDMMNVWEVGHFLLGFCLPRLLSSHAHLRRLLGTHDIWHWPRTQDQEEYWYQHLSQFSLTLRPPDLLILLLNAFETFGPQFSEVAYLRYCGAFDEVHKRGPALENGFEEDEEILDDDSHKFELEDILYILQSGFYYHSRHLQSLALLCGKSSRSVAEEQIIDAYEGLRDVLDEGLGNSSFFRYWCQQVSSFIQNVMPDRYRGKIFEDEHVTHHRLLEEILHASRADSGSFTIAEG